VGRKDDLITSAGYRIGPAEIEDCLIKHPAVSMAGVIGSPDEMRGEIVKAFIVLNPQFAPDLALKKDIQQFVKSRLAAHEYPREIEFINELPLTATGKIMRKDLRKMDMAKKGGEIS
jgi:acetyl-CoA synthetase